MNDFFTTSDTCEASSILASGVQIERMEKSPNGRVHFYFPDRQKATEVSKQFWSKTLPIDAQTLLTEFKTLKYRVINL